MSKKTFISTILLLAFSLVMVHNIVPHHHHDDVSDVIHHEHHHDKQNHQDLDNGLFDLFSHLSHCTTTEFSSTHIYNFQKTQTLKQFIKNTDFIFRQLKIPIKSEPTHYIFITVRQFYYFTLFLRGPPVFIA